MAGLPIGAGRGCSRVLLEGAANGPSVTPPSNFPSLDDVGVIFGLAYGVLPGGASIDGGLEDGRVGDTGVLMLLVGGGLSVSTGVGVTAGEAKFVVVVVVVAGVSSEVDRGMIVMVGCVCGIGVDATATIGVAR